MTANELMRYRVSVTAAHIAAGKAGDCSRCPVALALTEATGDTEASVSEVEWELRINVHGRTILPPGEVRQFVRDFDDQPRREDDRTLDTAHKDYRPPEPFEFELPALDDPEWQEHCYCCEEIFDVAELDDEGVCEECRKDSPSCVPRETQGGEA